MPSTDPLDPRNKSLFKKRLHRPWDPGTLDNVSIPEIAIELPKTSSRQLLIGGFLNIQENSNKFANLDLLNDLKADQAIDYAKQLYLAKQKEELARKAAENKTLFALQQAKIATAKIQKSEQALFQERQLRTNKEAEIAEALKLLQEKEESQKKSQAKLRALETRIQESDTLFEQEIHVVLDREIEKLLIENEKIQSQLEMDAREKNHASEIKFQTLEKALLDSKAELDEKLKITQDRAEEKVRQAELQKREKIRQIEEICHRQIKEAQEKMHFHEKAKLTAQGWVQKHLETARQAELTKTELKANLEAAQLQIQSFQSQLQQAIQTTSAVEAEKTSFINQISSSLEIVKKMESILIVERNLRKAMDEKLSSFDIREEEAKRKHLEDKVLEVTKTLSDAEMAKLKADEKLFETLEKLQQLDILIDSERNLKKGLEEQIEKMQLNTEETHKALMKKIGQLEQIKRDVIQAKESTEQKMCLLANEKHILEQEKNQNRDKLSKMQEKIKELELVLETEKYLRKEAEKTRNQEEMLRKAAQEKISLAIEQANKTVLNVLGNFTNDPNVIERI
jgi:hypothetical protein